MFLVDFEISFIPSLAGIAQMTSGLFGSPPSFPPIHITSSLEHTHRRFGCFVQSHLLEVLHWLILSMRLFFFSYKLLISYYCAPNVIRVQEGLSDSMERIRGLRSS